MQNIADTPVPAPTERHLDFLGFVELLIQNGLAAMKGLIPLVWIQSRTSPVLFFLGGVITLLAYYAITSIAPSHDPAEPPLIKPKIPVVGHLWRLLRSQVNYFSELYNETQLPIATLPIGNRKLYVIFDASLQQAALKAKDMDAQSFMVDFVPRIFGVRQGTVDKLLGRDGVHPNIMADMEGVFKSALSGDNLSRLATTTLAEVATALNGIDKEKGQDVPNLFIWFQNLLSKATSRALWGEKHNPYTDQGVIDAQWDFEANMGPLVLGILPSIIARKAYLARTKVQTALQPYYRARIDQNDPSVSEFVRARSRLLRTYDLPDDELAKNEIAITLVATTNALSTLFWCVAEIFSRPDLLAEIRAEIYRAVINDSSTAIPPQNPPADTTKTITINAAGLEAKCPLLASCYRESIRLASQIVTARRVLKDTLISSSTSTGDGKTYLLRADTNVMMPAKVVHRNPATWGPDADEFNPRRFLADESSSPSAARVRNMRASFVPFGGGKHLCPGRHFAFTENTAIMAALALGFDIVGLGRERLRMGDSKRGETAKPVAGLEGGEVVIRRREGWEGIVWGFEC